MTDLLTSAAPTFSAFDEGRLIASGTLAEVAIELLRIGADQGPRTALIFSDLTGGVIDFDLGGPRAEIEARADRRVAALRRAGDDEAPHRGRGRPRLGVVSREVTLLPRHWAWLSAQRGGASATLRRLVDDARRTHEARDRARKAQDATYRFLSAVAGDFAGYEETIRALFRSDRSAFQTHSSSWPDDLRAYALRLAAPAMDARPPTPPEIGDPTSGTPLSEQG